MPLDTDLYDSGERICNEAGGAAVVLLETMLRRGLIAPPELAQLAQQIVEKHARGEGLCRRAIHGRAA